MDNQALKKLDEIQQQNSLLMPALLAALTPTLEQITTQSTNQIRGDLTRLPDLTATAVQAAPCNGRGCGGSTARRVNELGDRLTARDATLKQLEAKANQTNAISLPGIYRKTLETLATVTRNADKLKQIFDKLESFAKKTDEAFSKVYRRFKMPEILTAVNTILALHNVTMLSRYAVQTIGDLMSMGLQIIGLKNEDGGPYDINAVVGKSVMSMIEQILGKATTEQIQARWQSANKIYQSSANVLWSVSSLADASRSIMEWTAENTGKIGNALKRAKVVDPSDYPWMSESVNSGTARQRQIQRITEGIEGIENTASSLQTVAGDIISIQQEIEQAKQAKAEFKQAVAELTPKSSIVNKPIADMQTAITKASKAPETVATVDLGASD